MGFFEDVYKRAENEVKGAARNVLNPVQQFEDDMGRIGDDINSLTNNLGQGTQEEFSWGTVNAEGKKAQTAEELRKEEERRALSEASEEQRRRSLGGRASTLLYGNSGGTTSLASGSVARRTLAGY